MSRTSTCPVEVETGNRREVASQIPELVLSGGGRWSVEKLLEDLRSHLHINLSKVL